MGKPHKPHPHKVYVYPDRHSFVLIFVRDFPTFASALAYARAEFTFGTFHIDSGDYAPSREEQLGEAVKAKRVVKLSLFDDI